MLISSLKNPLSRSSQQGFTQKSQKKNPQKYRNEKCEEEGIKFDSRHERDVYLELKMQMRAQDPADRVVSIKLQPKYKIHPAYRIGKKSVRAIYYIGDFEVKYDDGRVDTIDAKGVETDVFRIKRKMFEKKFNKEIILK